MLGDLTYGKIGDLLHELVIELDDIGPTTPLMVEMVEQIRKLRVDADKLWLTQEFER